MPLDRFLRLFKGAGGEPVGPFSGALELLDLARKTYCDIAERHNARTQSESLRAVVSKVVASQRDGKDTAAGIIRFSVSTSFWAIVVRVSVDTVQFFVLPAVQLPLLGEAETASRLKLRLRAEKSGGESRVLMDDVVVTLDEAETLMAALFKDILQRSQNDFDFIPESVRVQYGDRSLTAAVRELIKEKGALTDRIAVQQESLQSYIASEIHDTVISDLLFLQRRIENDTPPEKDETVNLIESVVGKLRELCAELVPGNLGDWGLSVLLEDMFNKVCARSGLQGVFLCHCEIPELAQDVELQVFRIIQECLNNLEKHANATQANLTIEREGTELTITVADNGVGYERSSNDARKGSGLSIMTERVNLIRLQIPASLQFESKPGSGTRAILKIHF